MGKSIALFVKEKERFFKKKACVNCSINNFCGCDGADLLFGIDRVIMQGLFNVGEGIRMRKLFVVEKGLITGENVFASISHNGILAIYADDKGIVQFTSLNNNEKVEINVESTSHVGFYDNKILLLTQGKPLREATVNEVFENPEIKTFREIKGTHNVNPLTDVSLLNARKKLYYPTMDKRLFVFEVDTRKNEEIVTGKRVRLIASLIGIDCGISALFQDDDDNCTYTLNIDGTITKVRGRQDNNLSTLFPSLYNPKDMKDAVFKYGSDLMKNENKIIINHLINFAWGSIVRVYKDVFLTYDHNTKSWVIFRIAAPLFHRSDIFSKAYISKRVCSVSYFDEKRKREPHIQQKFSYIVDMRS